MAEAYVPQDGDGPLQNLYNFFRTGIVLKINKHVQSETIRNISGIITISARTPGIGVINIENNASDNTNWKRAVDRLLNCSFPGVQCVKIRKNGTQLSTFEHLCRLPQIHTLMMRNSFILADPTTFNEEGEEHTQGMNEVLDVATPEDFDRIIRSIASSTLEHVVVRNIASTKVQKLLDACERIAESGYAQQGKPVCMFIIPDEQINDDDFDKIEEKSIVCSNAFTKIKWEIYRFMEEFEDKQPTLYELWQRLEEVQ